MVTLIYAFMVGVSCDVGFDVGFACLVCVVMVTVEVCYDACGRLVHFVTGG